MASIRIPERYLSGLVKFLSLSNESLQAWFTALERATPRIEPNEILKNTISTVDRIAPEDARDIVEATTALHMLFAGSEKSIAEFSDEFLEALVTAAPEGLPLTDEDKNQVKLHIERFFGIDSLTLASKASSVLFDQERIFAKSRILTDIRPVFGTDVKEAPKASIITNTLNIHYYEGTQHKEFYVTLDAKDLQVLLDTVERAKAKTETLKALIATTNIPYIEPE